MENIKLAEIKTKDRLVLPGLLFEPGKRTDRVAIFLHGNGSPGIFYSLARNREIARQLNGKGVSYLAFNNRGAMAYHQLKYYRSGKEYRVPAGMAFELIKDCVTDIDAAIAFLKRQGYKEFYLVGYSTGANKICVYNFYRPKNPVSKYILFSGGDDSGLYYKMFGKKKFFAVLKLSQQKIKQGKGEELVPKDILPYPYSYRALYDIMDPDGDYNIFPFWDVLHHLNLSKKQLFKEYKTIRKPTLVIYGGKDEYCYGRAKEIMELMKRECPDPKNFKFTFVPGADHGFSGKERLLAKIISDWV